MLVFLFVVLTIGCKEKTQLEIDVIAVHDEVMPKMGDIHKAKKQLRKIMKTVENDSVSTQILNLIQDLENADEGMMDWMHNWDVPKDDPEKTAYLNKEMEKITKVKVDMLSSIESANAFIDKMNK